MTVRDLTFEYKAYQMDKSHNWYMDKGQADLASCQLHKLLLHD